MPTDFYFSNHGSICVLAANTVEAKVWMEDHLPMDNPETQFVGRDGIVIEPRYAGDILRGIQQDGLTVGRMQDAAGRFV